MACQIESWRESWRTNITAANFADNGPVRQSGQRTTACPMRGASVYPLGATGGHLLCRAHTHIKFVLLCSPDGTKWAQEKIRPGPVLGFFVAGAVLVSTGLEKRHSGPFPGLLALVCGVIGCWRIARNDVPTEGRCIP